MHILEGDHSSDSVEKAAGEDGAVVEVVADAEVGEGESGVPVIDARYRWYIVNTYSGSEETGGAIVVVASVFCCGLLTTISSGLCVH